jgi:hypothetical protein
MVAATFRTPVLQVTLRSRMPSTAVVCGAGGPTTCGPVTAPIYPGRLTFAYDSNTRIFPQDPGICPSGLMEVVTGAYTADKFGAHVDVAYTIRFTRG